MTPNKMLAALLGFSIAVLASPATAQQGQQMQWNSPRDMAINMCLAQAHKTFRANGQDVQRAQSYRACMVKKAFILELSRGKITGASLR